MNRYAALSASLFFTLMGGLSLGRSEVAIAQTEREFCPAGTEAVPLDVVGGEGTEVEKTPTNPTFPVPLPGPLPSITIRDNYNTDWAIPGRDHYQQFVVAIVPDDSDDYDIEVHLKYGDDTDEEIYERGSTDLTEGELFLITAEPRDDLQPYQVNLRVGDEAIGNAYTATVIGCRAPQTPAPLAADGACLPLIVVGGDEGQTWIEKQVSVPGIPGPFGLRVRNNWNTDWVIPLPQRFSRFVATIESTEEDEEGTYDIEVNLKYPDDTADEVFDADSYQLNVGDPLVVEATPRLEAHPYQVNVFVGGIDHIDNDYRAMVQACY